VPVVALLIGRNHEVFPLVCPLSGGNMRIIAFITERLQIRQILETRMTASTMSIRFESVVEIVDIERGVWPRPSPWRRTSFGLPFGHAG